MKKLLLAAVAAIVLVTLGAGGVFGWADSQTRRPLKPGAETVTFTVPKGATGNGLGRLLEEKGLIADARIWRFHLWRRGGLQAKAGDFDLSAGMSPAEIAATLEENPIPQDEPFVMIEGWRLRDTDAALAQKGWIKPGEYIAAAREPKAFKATFPLPAESLEGYLYPETYKVVPGSFSVRDLIQRQLDTFGRRFYEVHKDDITKSGRALHDVVIMASLLEREEPLPEQRPLVAGILWKRIDKRVPLGVDATSRYLLPEWNDRGAFLKRLRDPQDPWNTRTKVGLPPGPIGAPTVESLLAAMRPKPSEYWYYLHDGQRILRPSRNAQEHEALRRQYNVY